MPIEFHGMGLKQLWGAGGVGAGPEGRFGRSRLGGRAVGPGVEEVGAGFGEGWCQGWIEDGTFGWSGGAEAVFSVLHVGLGVTEGVKRCGVA